MSSSLALPSFSPFFSNGTSRIKNPLPRSTVFMSVSAGSKTSVNDALFADYKASTSFLFLGQGAQAAGMGKEAQNVPAAAVLFNKAND